jgi:hypothetical protein
MKRTLWALLVASTALAGCSTDDSGACVSAVYNDLYTYCSDDWEKQECEEWQGGSAYHGGETCEDLGYTYYCAKTYTYHQSSAYCD